MRGWGQVRNTVRRECPGKGREGRFEGEESVGIGGIISGSQAVLWEVEGTTPGRANLFWVSSSFILAYSSIL